MSRSARGRTDDKNPGPEDRNAGHREQELGDRQKAVIDILVDMAIRRLLADPESPRSDEGK